MKLGWQSRPLGELCEFTRGLTYKKSDEVDFSTNAVLRANNITLETGTLNFDEIRYIDECVTIAQSKKVRKGSLLICTASGSKKHLGKIAYIDNDYDFAFGGFMGMLTPNGPVDAKYLYWLMSSQQYADFIACLSDGANINNLKFSQLAEFIVPLPPLAEQRRIVGILDEAFAGIARAVAATEKNLANARELFESQLNTVFTRKGEGWIEGLLSDVVSIKHGFAFKSEYFVESGNYVLLTPGNFFESGGYRDRGEKQKFYEGEIPDGYVLKKDDLLMAMTEQAAGLLGSSIVVPEDDIFLHNQRLGLLAPHVGIPWHSQFFFHQFNTRSFRQAAHDSASGVKVRHTSPTKLGNIHIGYPSKIAHQKRIAAELDKLALESQRLESLYRRKLAALAELKQALLQQAFAGELP